MYYIFQLDPMVRNFGKFIEFYWFLNFIELNFIDYELFPIFNDSRLLSFLCTIFKSCKIPFALILMSYLFFSKLESRTKLETDKFIKIPHHVQFL
jgi:hypothetical protein